MKTRCEFFNISAFTKPHEYNANISYFAESIWIFEYFYQSMSLDRPLFNTKWLSILSMIGVAVGLGNVWRFPYMMGKYGGSAFLVLYLVFTLLIAIPALMSEWAIGRQFRVGPLGAFRKIYGPTVGTAIGMLLFVTVLVADSYYLVVIGNVLFTGIYSLLTGFDASGTETYQQQLQNPLLQYPLTLMILLLTLIVLSKGLNQGIARVSSWFVPLFIIILIYLIGYVLTLEGAQGILMDFLRPDFSQVNASVVFAALGQSFFSLGLGGTYMLIYGSYVSKTQNLAESAVYTSLGDLGAAMLASCFIIPAVLLYGLDLATGPGLIFRVFPELFARMPLGNVVGGIFLIGLSMVAFLSNLAALEVVAGSQVDLGLAKMSRRKLLILIGVAEALLILPSVIFPNMIGHLDLIFGSGMQTFGSLIAVTGLTWFVGQEIARTQILGAADSKFGRFLFLWIKWVIPAVLFIILAGYILSL